MSALPLVVPLPGNAALAAGLAGALGAREGVLEARRFPDGESYLRYRTPLAGERVVLACTLDRPDEKFLPLAFTAAEARAQGAAQVGLVCPYLPYLRQDRRFHEGEALTSVHFARLLSGAVDWLVTVDPHLHRYGALDAVYTIPARAVTAAPLIAAWLRREVPDALVVGPDAESAQWAGAIAGLAGVPWVVLRKRRAGDREVEITLPALGEHAGRTPVLVDDIVSSGGTLITAVRALRAAGLAPAVCVAVHALFADDACTALRAAGAARIVTTNTVAHATNALDLTAALADAVRELTSLPV